MTTVWHRGKARTFKDDEQAEKWLEEIKMARKQKREPKAEAATGTDAPVVAEAVKPTATAPKVVAPDSCASCGVTVEENNLGGFSVTHPTRFGSPISATATNVAEAASWLERVHAEES